MVLWPLRVQLVLQSLLVALLARSAFAAEAAGPGDPDRALPDFSYYHTKTSLLTEVQRITDYRPDIFKVRTETRASGNYSASVRVITASYGGFGGDPAWKLRVLLDFGQHGREFVSSETGLRLLALLADEAELRRFCHRQGIELDPLQRALQHTMFEVSPRCSCELPSSKVLPLENERGRQKVESRNLCERKNGRGVDINRNWPVHWGFKEPDYDSREEYPGDEPFSEPEAAAVRDVAVAFRPHAWVNVHSGMEGLFMPYDHVAVIPDGPDAAASLAILQSNTVQAQELNATACRGRCVVGSGGKSVGYLAHGTATDWMHEELHVPMAFTWEIYGNMTADFHDCFRMFNPVDKATLESVVNDWAGAVLRLVALMPGHPAVQRDLPGIAATLAQPVLPDPHGNVTEAGTLDAVLIARQRKLDESAGRWSGGSLGKPHAAGLLSMRLLLLPAALFAYVVINSARKSALWKSIMRMQRTGSRRTLLPK